MTLPELIGPFIWFILCTWYQRHGEKCWKQTLKYQQCSCARKKNLEDNLQPWNWFLVYTISENIFELKKLFIFSGTSFSWVGKMLFSMGSHLTTNLISHQCTDLGFIDQCSMKRRCLKFHTNLWIINLINWLNMNYQVDLKIK